jgi:hypothetical protein
MDRPSLSNRRRVRKEQVGVMMALVYFRRRATEVIQERVDLDPETTRAKWG